MPDSNELKFDRLRELAENLIRQNGTTPGESEGEMTRLLHELRVHQVELNIQNEELQRAQEELATSKQEYADLFDYAPVAYFVIDEENIIKQANLTAVAKFGTTRQALYGKPFAYLVAAKERDKYYKYHRSLVNTLQQQKIEVWFENNGTGAFYGRIETVVVNEEDEAKTFRVAITDITERKKYEEHLEAIHQLDQVILERSPASTVVEMVIDQLRRSTGCHHVAIILFDDDDSQVNYFIKNYGNQAAQRYGKLRHMKGDAVAFKNLARWNNDHVHVMQNPSFLSQEIGGSYPAHLFAPIRNDGNLKGLIDLGAGWADDFDAVPTEFVRQLAVQLGIALQQAEFLEQLQNYMTQLKTMVDERTAQLRESQYNERKQRLFAEGLLAIVKQINQSLDPEFVLEQILVTLENIIAYDGARIIISGSDGAEVMIQSRGKLQLPAEALSTSMAFEVHPIHVKMLRTGEPALIREDVRQLWDDEASKAPIESYLGAPIQSGREVLGFIDLYGAQTDAFDREDVNRLQAFAEQASIALKNARFHQKGQELAALEERQRLARDLHDAVSQLIFSLSIMSESLPKVIKDQEYDKANEISEMMHIVASSTHAEMRLLLLELRPMSFERIELDELLHQLATAFLGRHSKLTTKVDAQRTPPLSIDAKNNLYRIAQEALNNSGKHAQAQNIKIKLWMQDEIIHLSIEDDGKGFEFNGQSSGYGLGIMRERAENIGAEYVITSEVGKGTQVYVTFNPAD